MESLKDMRNADKLTFFQFLGKTSKKYEGEAMGPNQLSSYKTRLCAEFERTGQCRFGVHCQDAHGQQELQSQPTASSEGHLANMPEALKVGNGFNKQVLNFAMPNSKCTCCYLCGATFTTLTRKHHCRMCGQIFCQACSSQKIDARFPKLPTYNFAGFVRVCDYCSDFFEVHFPQYSHVEDLSKAERISEKYMNEQIVNFVKAETRRLQCGDDQSGGQRAGANASHREPMRNIYVRGKYASRSNAFDLYSKHLLSGQHHLRHFAEASSGNTSRESRTEGDEVLDSALSHKADNQSDILRSMISVLLAQKGVGDRITDHEAWTPVLVNLVKTIVSRTTPDTSRGDMLDIRHFTHFKVIDGGEPQDSCCLSGVVMRKNLAHRRMQNNLVNPRIVLFDTSIEYHRVAELTHLGVLGQQNHAYVLRLVAKLMTLRPTLVMLTGHMCCDAQEMLYSSGVSVVLNVKRQVLERLSRVTGARIITSADHVDKFPSKEVVGTGCSLFKVSVLGPPEKLKLPSSVYLVFECEPNNLTTTLIRGLPKTEENAELRQSMKRILRAAVLFWYHQTLELSFFADSCRALKDYSPKVPFGDTVAPTFTSSAGIDLTDVDDMKRWLSRVALDDHKTSLGESECVTDASSVRPRLSRVISFDSVLTLIKTNPKYEYLDVRNHFEASMGRKLDRKEKILLEDGIRYAEHKCSRNARVPWLWAWQCELDAALLRYTTVWINMRKLDTRKRGKENAEWGEAQIVPARTMQVAFYSHSDCALGQWLSRCTTNEDRSPKQRMLRWRRPEMTPNSAHIGLSPEIKAASPRTKPTRRHRCFFKGDTAVHVVVSRIDKSVADEREEHEPIMMWVWSRLHQKQLHAPVKLSVGASGMSFAKFLEMAFANQSFIDYVWFFSINCYIIRFEHEAILRYKVIAPNVMSSEPHREYVAEELKRIIPQATDMAARVLRKCRSIEKSLQRRLKAIHEILTPRVPDTISSTPRGTVLNPDGSVLATSDPTKLVVSASTSNPDSDQKASASTSLMAAFQSPSNVDAEEPTASISSSSFTDTQSLSPLASDTTTPRTPRVDVAPPMPPATAETSSEGLKHDAESTKAPPDLSPSCSPHRNRPPSKFILDAKAPVQARLAKIEQLKAMVAADRKLIIERVKTVMNKALATGPDKESKQDASQRTTMLSMNISQLKVNAVWRELFFMTKTWVLMLDDIVYFQASKANQMASPKMSIGSLSSPETNATPPSPSGGGGGGGDKKQVPAASLPANTGVSSGQGGPSTSDTDGAGRSDTSLSVPPSRAVDDDGSRDSVGSSGGDGGNGNGGDGGGDKTVLSQTTADNDGARGNSDDGGDGDVADARDPDVATADPSVESPSVSEAATPPSSRSLSSLLTSQSAPAKASHPSLLLVRTQSERNAAAKSKSSLRQSMTPKLHRDLLASARLNPASKSFHSLTSLARRTAMQTPPRRGADSDGEGGSDDEDNSTRGARFMQWLASPGAQVLDTPPVASPFSNLEPVAEDEDFWVDDNSKDNNLISLGESSTLDTPEPSPRGASRKPADNALMASASDTNLSQPPRVMPPLSSPKSRATSMPGDVMAEAMAAREPTRHHRRATAPNFGDLATQDSFRHVRGRLSAGAAPSSRSWADYFKRSTKRRHYTPQTDLNMCPEMRDYHAGLNAGINGIVVLVREELRNDGESFKVSVQLTTVLAHSLCSEVYHAKIQTLVNEALRVHITQAAKEEHSRPTSESSIPTTFSAPSDAADPDPPADSGPAASTSSASDETKTRTLASMTIPDAQRYARDYFTPGRSHPLEEKSSDMHSLDKDVLKALLLCDERDVKTGFHHAITHTCRDPYTQDEFTCVSYSALQFAALRRLYCQGFDDLEFIESLSRSTPWDTSGGKTGALFQKTLDGRFLIKDINSHELNGFQANAPSYFAHMYDTFNGQETVLARILGVYYIKLTHVFDGSNRTQESYRLIVMENLFYGRDPMRLRAFDLKGSRSNRLVETDGDDAETEKVLLDSNFMRSTQGFPLPLLEPSKNLLTTALHNDTTFLSRKSWNYMNLKPVMDYSLLVALDDVRRELVVGIIDYLRPYDALKWMESHTKQAIFQHQPTVIEPNKYKTRFVDKCDSYFASIPDADA